MNLAEVFEPITSALSPEAPWGQVGLRAAQGAVVGGLFGGAVAIFSKNEISSRLTNTSKIAVVALAAITFAAVTALLVGAYVAYGAIPTLAAALVIIASNKRDFVGDMAKAGFVLLVTRLALRLLQSL